MGLLGQRLQGGHDAKTPPSLVQNLDRVFTQSPVQIRGSSKMTPQQGKRRPEAPPSSVPAGTPAKTFARSINPSLHSHGLALPDHSHNSIFEATPPLRLHAPCRCQTSTSAAPSRSLVSNTCKDRWTKRGVNWAFFKFLKQLKQP